MKKIKGLGVSVGAFVVAVSANAWAQNGAASSVPASASGASAMVASGAATPETGRKANRALRRRVYAAISQHREISAGNISVVARDGAVTLNGTVTDATQIDKVAEITKGVPGVTSVTNKLSVQRRPFGSQ
ncbi:hyperosmotically inducible protein [Paraburkholderia sp. GAS448]|uniref:BON domain-containing protein n=1 Tax=Paraburkholderia sp. GAS448 TaxID=3035136 RepID=UPI003D245ABA